MEDYNYKREIRGISAAWHKLEVPDELFAKINPALTDLRIYGITSNNDTIEAPYLIERSNKRHVDNQLRFNLINQVSKGEKHYFTFEITTESTINHIELNFKQTNFDWKVTLEGSNDQAEWFTIQKDYRIVSINNLFTDYQFTTVRFPDTRYRYMRIQINTDKKPVLRMAKISEQKLIAGNYKPYAVSEIETSENKKSRQSTIDLKVAFIAPVSYLKIGVKDTIDYYRPLTIKYLADSSNSPKGWKYHYRTLLTGTLSSMEENEFYFNTTTLNKLKIIIDNHDNEPLTIDTFEVKGYVHELIARFTEPATYYLVYGNKKAPKPRYDITEFASYIPASLTKLSLAEESVIPKEEKSSKDPIFQNKAWLWAIMVIIILILGWFSRSMLKKANESTNDNS